uniref:Uncharacterized protein AlNc14C149G7477 n=1 Tax=Albugo laibachii Nc14 TaxID=890382 RepID=F0WLW4_9STRA|nr:conserved hypothetical protein [Albugo laibachii Nc14]|eukprot:CCA22290.1 conserved hypothetical protein [Albugo laibachii Nc14]
MSGAYTVSKMLDTINKTMEMKGCGRGTSTVTLKRKVDNGIMMDITPQEVAYLDTQAKIRHSAMEVSQMQHNDEREKWMWKQKELGNEAFAQKEYLRAADIYIQALTGMTSTKPAAKWMIDYQLQLTCNLTACMLMTKARKT